MSEFVARWIDLGPVSPSSLHAHYTGLAEAQAPDAAPIILWGTSALSHLSVGASQDPLSELDLEACRQRRVAWLRRPLGGGTVLVDARQYSYFFILPRDFSGGLPLQARALFPLLSPVILGVYRALNLPVTAYAGHDFWLHGRKIAGTGAASIGTSHVFASSFVRAFDYELFAQLIAAPSAGFREWLGEELAQSMVTMEAVARMPEEAQMRQLLRHQIRQDLGWRVESDTPSSREEQAIGVALDNWDRDWGGAEDLPSMHKRVPHGIKIKAGMFLTERHWDGSWVRILTENGVLKRVAASFLETGAAQRLQGMPPTRAVLQRALSGSGVKQPELWAERIEKLAYLSDIAQER